MKKAILIILALGAMASANGFYGGVSEINHQRFFNDSRDWFSTGHDNSLNYGAGVQLGYNAGNIGEMEVAAELRASKVYVDTFDGTKDMDTYSAFVKLGTDISGFTPYLLAGYTVIDSELDHITVRDFSWGLGISKAISDKVDIFVDYTVLPKIRVVNNEVVTVGLNYKF
ncbi:MAG: porin family protein [Candidatus Cloacimonetes bacterium]|nr:porin family protein [Candidatus Cloacimonadota bacterium]